MLLHLLARRARPAGLWLAVALCVGGIGPVRAQDYGLNETSTEWINRASKVAPASIDEAFGDQHSLYDGSVEFNVVDLALSGTGPAVELRRMFPVRDSRLLGDTGIAQGNGDRGELVDWSLDIPQISGVFEAQTGWQVEGSSPYARCSSGTKPRQISVFTGSQYWSGTELRIPGKGSELLLLNSGGKRPSPANGATYPWVTKGGWVISCKSTTANGFPGEAFVATSPDGTRYYLDWVVSHFYPGLVAYQVAESMTGQPIFAKIVRRKFYFLASKVEDRFGNSVSYQYSGDKLVGITASDGRQITLTYTGGRLTSAKAGSQTYTYSYEAGPLTTVVLPDASRWRYAQTGKLEIQHETGMELQNQPCHVEGSVGSDFVYSITNPAGANAEFKFAVKRHVKQNVPEICVTWRYGDPDQPSSLSYVSFWQIPLYSDEYSLVQKTLSGPGVATGTWTYAYQLVNLGARGFQAQCTANPSSCPLTKTVVVQGPLSYERYTFGIWWGVNDGQLLKKETGGSVNDILRTEDYTYVSASEAGTQPFGNAVGTEIHWYLDKLHSFNRPIKTVTTTQQAATFRRSNLAYDVFARPTSTEVSSSLGYSRTDAFGYFDQLSSWVIGQPRTQTCTAPSGCAGSVVSQTDYDPATALPVRSYRFGKLLRALSYNADGTVAAVNDGAGNRTTFAAWKRGIPQRVTYPATTDQPTPVSETAVVDDNGWITSLTDESGAKTCYGYDAMGRVARVTYPSEAAMGVCDSSTWAVTGRNFQPVDRIEYGLPAGHWKQIIATGNDVQGIYYDALWRPVAEGRFDAADSIGTRSLTIRRYDALGRALFQSYPLSNAGSYADTTLPGVHTSYDALGRVVRVEQDSESGALVTTTEYLDGFRTRVTNPRGQVTTTSYMAYDQPTTDWPVAITHPAGAFTHITRDVFGKPTRLRRSNSSSPTGGTVALDRSYAYNDNEELCRTVEPETGATLMGYDAAGNLAWSASGLPAGTACDANGNTAAILVRKAVRSYDARNRLLALGFADKGADVSSTYTLTGQLATTTAANYGTTPVTTTYAYNARGLMTGEELQFGSIAYTSLYTYDANGHLASRNNAGFAYALAPNALGQPTQVGSVVTGISYYPNGAPKQFTYGNGIVHTLTQNARQLPERSRDAYGSTAVLDDSYDYDANGNVLAISDGATGRGQRGNRDMTYDALDRLTDVASPMFGSAGAHYTYDVLDNLTRVVAPGRDHWYCFDASWRLTNVKTGGCGGSTVIGLGYDVQGNVANKNGTAGGLYTFDMGNRLRKAQVGSLVTSYIYDGHGRRVRDYNTASKYSFYDAGGQLVYARDLRQNTQAWYLYLGNSLVAIREHDVATGVSQYKYQHTDALGSPVAVTDQSRNVIERSEYEPHGKLLNRPLADGPGFTGHVGDATTGLVYMQQRYYDPVIGRFLSRDPVTAYSIGDMRFFNGYAYAFNNPYKFNDPDGRCPSCAVRGAQLEFDLVFWLATRAGAATLGSWLGLKIYDLTHYNEANEGGDKPKGKDVKPPQYPANPDEWVPPDGWAETPAGEKTGGRHRQWKDPGGKIRRRWDREGREGGKERGSHWHDADDESGGRDHIDPDDVPVPEKREPSPNPPRDQE